MIAKNLNYDQKMYECKLRICMCKNKFLISSIAINYEIHYF